MVNHGPSKGCSTCRKRRVKCDEGKPSCRECLRFRRVCGGYESKQKTGGFRFRDQGAGANLLQPTSRSRSPHLSIKPGLTLQAAIPATISPSDESFAVSFFLTSIAGLGRSFNSTQGFLEPLFPAVAKEHPDSVLSTVLAAVATKLWSMWKSPTNTYRTPHPPFTKALRRLQAALNDPIERSKDSTVLSAILMHFYESIAARSTHQHTMRAHQDGARALLDHGARNIRDSECRAYLRGYLRHCDVSNYMELQLDDTSSLDVWFSAGWDYSMPASPNAVLDLIGLSIADLQKRLSPFMRGLAKNNLDGLTLATWWQEASSVNAQLLDWVHLVPASWQPYKRSQEDTFSYFGYCDIYPTVQIATIWNVWRVCQLMVLRMKLYLLTKAPTEALQQIVLIATKDNSFPDPKHCRELVDSICRSMPFYLGNRQNHGGLHDLDDPAIRFPNYHDRDLDEAIRTQYFQGDQAMSLFDYKRHILIQGPSHALLHLNSLIKVLSKEGGELIYRELHRDKVAWIQEQFLRLNAQSAKPVLIEYRSSEAYTSGGSQESGGLRSAQGSPLYDSLKLSGNQIRLLTIKSTMPEISCEMDVTDLHDQLPFNALSYVWGDPKITEIIRVNGHEHPVTTSLASALRCAPQHLSQSKHAAGQKLWVDAICINQADDDEKSHQVAKMGEIYSQSGLVLCWLGPLSDSIGTAIDVIQITAFERYFRLERFKEVKDTKQLSVADTTSATPRQVGYIEIYELANALEHATTVTGRVLQSPYGSELEFCKNDLIILCREVRDWQDRLQRQASKLDANVIKGSHPVGFLSKLVSSRIHKFQKIVEDFVFQVIGDEVYGHLLWLKEYPSLCVVEEIVGQCHRGPAQPLFDLPYWSRIWIRQEIILAKQAVFICGPRSFSLQTLEYFSAWLGWILSPSNSRLCQKEKLFKLILAYKQNWKLLHHIFKGRRDQGLPVGNWLGQSHFKTNIWCHSSDARATNPKDYYYGFLGITKLKIVPDYSSSKSIGSVSREFMAEYLKVYRDQSLSNDLLGGPLGLLMFAGVGYGWTADLDMPSWGPNFPGEAQSEPSTRGAADAVAFPLNSDIENIFEKEPIETIIDLDMEVTLYILDCIKMIGPRVSDYGRPELLHSEGLPITWALDFALRHESYTSGGHPLTAFRQLLEPLAVSQSKETGFPIENGLEFLKFLGRFNRPFQKGRPCSRAMLARFCYVRNFLAQVPVSVPSLTLCPHLIVKDPDDDDDEDEYTKEYRYIELLGAKCRPYNHTIAETKKGYIGRFPPRIQEGDLVCLLNGLNQPAVLRKVA
ncbi:hypothetical protein FNAPI_9064 [Fusarium napiforme]|uniref:Zn(2)-C6 fungal-type domain-containing protein n=1 Tax=Fusarium napiforme TaxID=42672 RepID=A0A8H5IYL7_9HYPO|nr:hypothetical protein FNAPI_9064 [Fusarium napiforme]